MYHKCKYTKKEIIQTNNSAKNEKIQRNNWVKNEKIQRKTKVRQNNEGDRNLSPKILSLTTFSSVTTRPFVQARWLSLLRRFEK
jgi:hypothetical protein